MGKFTKCGAGLSYCLIIGPLVWERCHLQGFTLHKITTSYNIEGATNTTNTTREEHILWYYYNCIFKNPLSDILLACSITAEENGVNQGPNNLISLHCF